MRILFKELGKILKEDFEDLGKNFEECPDKTDFVWQRCETEVIGEQTRKGLLTEGTSDNGTFTGLLTNYLSFAPPSYKIGLIRTLIDRVFKINNTWLGFHKDIVNLVFILRKNLFPVHLIDKCVYRYLNTAIDRNGSIQNTTSQGKQYFYKLP